MSAPISDFYDPERLAELRQVERTTYAAYKRMIAAAVADPKLNLARTPDGQLAPTEKFFKILSAFRSREYQDQLRREVANARRGGLAVYSSHFTCRALDLLFGGAPLGTKESKRATLMEMPLFPLLDVIAR